ncbi:MAG: hypothetical protein WBB25_20375 [Sulfitobacter sp.]
MKTRGCAVPGDSLLQAYVGQGATYTDCFEITSPVTVTLPDFIEAFYTTWLFRLERALLTVTLGRRIRDADVQALASGAGRFAAWTVEAREEAQILLADLSGQTRSYLATSPQEGGGTRLIFGSAVVVAEGQPLGRMISVLTPLHRFYSKALLHLAERKLRTR